MIPTLSAGMNLQKMLEAEQHKKIMESLAPVPSATDSSLPTNSVSAATSTRQTTTTTTPTGIYKPEEVEVASRRAVADADGYAQRAASVRPVTSRAIEDVKENAKLAKQQSEANKDATLEQTVAVFNAAKATHERNAASINEAVKILDDPEMAKLSAALNENAQASMAKLVAAGQQANKGGVWNTLAGAVKSELALSNVQKQVSAVNMLEQRKSQTVNALFEALKVNAEEGKKPYADEIARTEFIVSQSAALANNAMNKVMIDKTQIESIGAALSLDREGTQALMQKLQVMMAGNNASESVIARELQSLNLASAIRREKREIEALKYDESYYAQKEADLVSFAEQRGIPLKTTYRELLMAKELEGQPNQLLGDFLIFSQMVDDNGLNAVSKAVYGFDSSMPVPEQSQLAYQFASSGIPNQVADFRAQAERAWQQKHQPDKENARPQGKDLDAINQKVAEYEAQISLYNPDGTPNQKGITFWNNQFNNFMSNVNVNSTDAIKAGIVSLTGMEIMTKSPDFMKQVMLTLPKEAREWLEANPNQMLSLKPDADLSTQFKSNAVAIIGSTLTGDDIMDNSKVMSLAKNASAVHASMYKARREQQRDIHPKWQRTIIKLNGFGSVSEINLEDSKSLENAYTQMLMQERAARVKLLSTNPRR